MSELVNKTILITGSAGGLGKDLIELFKEKNFLILIDKSPNRNLQNLPNCIYIQADVTDGNLLEEQLNAAITRIGKKIDGIVNTVAVPDYKKFSETTFEEMRQVVDTKVLGYAYTIKVCLPHLNQGASIINVASVHAYSTSPESRTLYSAANAGVIGLTKALSVSEDLRHKARINVLCPGGFVTEEYKTYYPDWEAKLKKGQILPIRDVSNVIEFLLSDKSTGINGAEVKAEVGTSNLRSSSSSW